VEICRNHDRLREVEFPIEKKDSRTLFQHPSMKINSTKIKAVGLPAQITQVEISSPAKINLFLELLGKRGDGYHEIETIMATVGVYDQMRFTLRDDDQINLEMEPSAVKDSGTRASPMDAIPTDGRNLIVQALELLRNRSVSLDGSASQTCSRLNRLGCDVILRKKIPSAAGLGGASGNAVAALVAGCALWRLRFSKEELFEMAAELGSDVPFFLHGGSCVCRGRGEKIESIAASSGISVVIAAPPIGLSTASVFANFKMQLEKRSVKPALQSVIAGSPTRIARCLFNRLQETAMELNPQLALVADAFRDIGCLNHQMSGSGSAWFGIFASHRTARIAANVLSQRLPEVRIFCTKTISHTMVPTPFVDGQ